MARSLPLRSRAGWLVAGMVVLGAIASLPTRAYAFGVAPDEIEVALDEPVALVPETEHDEALLPESKQEVLASLTVPEVAPVATHVVLPQYPALAAQSRVQGTVYARVLVDTSGQVTQVGQVKGPAVFHEAVKTAAAKWEFSPARQGTLAVRTWVTVPFSFEM